MIDLAVFLKQNGYRPDQVQEIGLNGSGRGCSTALLFATL